MSKFGINLAWNTQGRLSRRTYKDTAGKLDWINVVCIVLAAIIALNFTQQNMPLSIAAVAAVMVVVLYVQYRTAQLSIRRLHDRGLPGFLFWPVLMMGLGVMGFGAWILVQAMYDGGLWGFLWSLLQLTQPLAELVLFNGIGLSVAALILLYNLFIGYNLNAEGARGDNRYGPPEV